VQINQFFGTKNYKQFVPHNIMISNEFAYLAYYNEGLRIYDLRINPPREIAVYDTYLTNGGFNMNGAWGIFNQWPSGRILLADRQNGLFVFDFEEEKFKVESPQEWLLYPNPALDEWVTLRSEKDNIVNFEIQIIDAKGKMIYSKITENASFCTFKPEFSTGLYLVKVCYTSSDGATAHQTIRFVKD